MVVRLIALLAMLLPVAAGAQAYSCHPDAAGSLIPHAGDGGARDGGPRRVPTTGYTMSMIWSPEYCRTRSTSARDAAECGAGQRFGFILHGVWPDGRGDQWPQYCRAVGLVPAAVIRATLCTTPSAQLMEHEWEKHGSCTGSDAAAFFADERRLFSSVRFPDMAALSRQGADGDAVARAFAAANPGWPAAAVRAVPNKQGWLDEVRVCLGLDKRPRPCPADSGTAPTAGALKIWRGGHAPDRGDQAAGG